MIFAQTIYVKISEIDYMILDNLNELWVISLFASRSNSNVTKEKSAKQKLFVKHSKLMFHAKRVL